MTKRVFSVRRTESFAQRLAAGNGFGNFFLPSADFFPVPEHGLAGCFSAAI
jgi:hypothetical protein